MSKADGKERERELEDVLAVMKMESGRAFVRRILGKARLYQTSFAGQSNQTIFNEGMRNLGLMILHDCEEASPELVIKMMSEDNDERNRNAG